MTSPDVIGASVADFFGLSPRKRKIISMKTHRKTASRLVSRDERGIGRSDGSGGHESAPQVSIQQPLELCVPDDVSFRCSAFRFQIMDDELAAARGEGTGRKREFHSRTNALDTLKDLDLSGKTFAITGTTSGIGIETARALALKGAHVIMFNRNIVESEKLKKRIEAEKPDAKVDFISCDLNSLQSAKAAGEEFISKHWPLHALILNAGVFAPTAKLTFDNFESHFGVNHLAHFVLVKELLPALRQSAPSRIVFVASISSSHTGLNKADLSRSEKVRVLCPENPAEFYYKLYAYSKMCNVLTAFKLHRDEFVSHGISTYAVHPGTMIGTDIARGFGVLSKVWNVISKPFTKSLSQGAATSVYCAAHPDVAEFSGKFWESCWDDEKSLDADVARNVALQDDLWEHSEGLVDEWLKAQKPISTIGHEELEEAAASSGDEDKAA